jgi:hypothetical protein
MQEGDDDSYAGCHGVLVRAPLRRIGGEIFSLTHEEEGTSFGPGPRTHGGQREDIPRWQVMIGVVGVTPTTTMLSTSRPLHACAEAEPTARPKRVTPDRQCRERDHLRVASRGGGRGHGEILGVVSA